MAEIKRRTARVRCVRELRGDHVQLVGVGLDAGIVAVYPVSDFACLDFVPRAGQVFTLTVDVETDGRWTDGQARIVGATPAGISDVVSSEP